MRRATTTRLGLVENLHTGARKKRGKINSTLAMITGKQFRSPTPKISLKKINRATQQDVLLFVSRSGASTPRNRREAASRCRCTAERSTRQGWRQGSRWFQICICAKHIPFSQSENQNQKRFAPTGNRTRVCTVAGYYSTTRPSVLAALRASFQVIYSLAIFGLIKPPSREKCQSVSLRSVPTKVLHSHHYHARTAAKTPLRTASASVFPGASSRDGRSWHVWPPHVFDSSRAEAAWDARRERRVPRLTPRLAPRLGAAASQPRLTLRLALRLLPQLLPRARTLNPKPNNPPRFRVKLLFECLP